MWRFTRKSLWASKRRLAGTSLAVLLGIAFLAGTFVMSDSMRARFDQAFTEANAGVDVVVRDSTTIGNEMSEQRRPISPEVIDAISSVDGVAASVASIDGVAQLIGADGTVVGTDGPPTMAGNWIEDDGINPWVLDEGRAPADSGEVVIDRASADSGDLDVGTVTTVQVPEPVEVEVVGIVRYGDADSLGPTTYTGFTEEDARRHLLGGQPGATGVLVAADSGVDETTLAERIGAILPDGAEAITGTELTEEMNADIEADFLGLMEMFLMVFAGVALIVASFSIYNTFSIIVAQRTRESALLRAIGASRRQVIASVTVEALVLGLVASLLGFAVGIGLAAGLFALFEAMEFSMPGDGLVVSVGSVVAAVLIGTGLTLVASLAPAVRASRVPPIAALRETAVDRTHTSKVRIVLGSSFAAAGFGFLVLGGIAGAFATVALGTAGLLVGMVLLGPVSARVGASVIGAPLGRLRGLVGVLARQNAMRNPRRTAGTASALMIGITIVVGFTVFAATLRTFIDDSVSDSVHADMVVSMSTWGGSGLSPQLVEELDAAPEVADAAGLGLGAVMIDGNGREVTVVEPAALAAVFDPGVVEGSLEELAPDELAVTSYTAEQRGWDLGTTVDVEFVDGARSTMSVGAVYERREILGEILIPEQTYVPHAIQYTNMMVFVGFADGVSAEAGRVAVEDVAAGYGAPPVESREEFVETAAGEIDMILTIVYGMLALAILIALLGIANTLALSVHERTRELGLLRAVGQLRSQLRAMVRWESVVIAVFGTLGGLGLGVLTGWAVVGAMGESEDLSLTFTLPTGQLALVVVVGAVAGVLAALRPAWRASKLDILDAIATE